MRPYHRWQFWFAILAAILVFLPRVASAYVAEYSYTIFAHPGLSDSLFRMGDNCDEGWESLLIKKPAQLTDDRFVKRSCNFIDDGDFVAYRLDNAKAQTGEGATNFFRAKGSVDGRAFSIWGVRTEAESFWFGSSFMFAVYAVLAGVILLLLFAKIFLIIRSKPRLAKNFSRAYLILAGVLLLFIIAERSVIFYTTTLKPNGGFNLRYYPSSANQCLAFSLLKKDAQIDRSPAALRAVHGCYFNIMKQDILFPVLKIAAGLAGGFAILYLGLFGRLNSLFSFLNKKE